MGSPSCIESAGGFALGKTFQEAEVTPFVRLGDFAKKEPTVTAAIRSRGRLVGGEASENLVVLDQELNAPSRDVELDHVARPDGGERAAHRGFRRDMQNVRPEARTTHAGIADANDVVNPLLEQLGGNRQMPPLGEARPAGGAGMLQHEDGVFVDLQAVVVDAAPATLRSDSKTTALPRCWSKWGEAAVCLMTAPSGARLP